MASLNKVFLIGNLTRNPELRSTPGGTSVCDLSMAVNRRYKLNDGSQKEETIFLDVVAWGHQGETANRYLQKGSPLFVEGRISVDSWEDKDKNRRSKYRIVAEKIQFLGSRGGYQQLQEPESEEYEERGEPQQSPQFKPQTARQQPRSVNPNQYHAPRNRDDAISPEPMPIPEEKEPPFEVDDQPGQEIPF